ncbi:methionine S-methyltransferase-like isoform X4 [Salvia hispanica]|uniref:methionine S-methyltransferase-like isoform X4 n=1 Tax=Salvia hispanica TaxID=49212 RepID=UPI00200987D9|nr:methionine S-methyltransferase-like isoform X4 [Salvia hispanica]
MGVVMEDFLKQCQHSGDAAYTAIRSLLERLEDPTTRTDARIFLSQLHKRFHSKEASESCLQTYHFQIQDIYLEQHEGFQKRRKLTMMVIPSIFMPEDWSFTFYEGINRHPDSIFKDRTVAELGCGNGWISIAIADKCSPLKVYGLDINPRAVKISWINLYMNALDENGNPIYDEENKTLLDRVEFHESDLLSYCRDNNIELERIVGCIPQILNPNPDAMSKMVTENASEEFLHSLSNYCALQGFVEDQFGLGLIARAVEEGISVIKPLGIMIFNMGGRPGQAVCRRLFERRGLRVDQLWQTKVLQAADTDISALVEIEKNSPHRFEFFMGLAGDQPICARTAWAYAKAGGRISHALSVYSCQLRQPNQNVVVFPSRTVAIESSLRLLSPRLAIVDEQLSRNLPKQWLTSLNVGKTESGKHSVGGVAVIEAPRQSDSMVELIRKLKPEVVVTGMTQFESVTSSAFERLTDITREIGCRLFVDISDHFELSSLPSSNGVLKYLAGNVLPSHVAIVCGLLKNQVYSDLEVAFVISEEEAMFKALCKTVELLHGNSSVISQYYYGCLFHELLAFQLADRHSLPERSVEKTRAFEVNGFSSSAISRLDHAELAVNESDEFPVVHMDVNQIFLPITTPVKASIFESFARQNISDSETDITSGIREMISTSYGFPSDSNSEFIYADSTVALFNKLVLCCIQEGGTLCFPTGSNGNYLSAAKFLNAKIANIPTNPEVGYKLTEKTLAGAVENINKPWVYISGPTISPTGLLYSNEEINKLLLVCAKFGATVILDTSFSGVEFNSKGFEGWNLTGTLEKLSSAHPNFCTALLGGLFSKMLTGGIKFGYLLINQPSLIETFHSFAGLSKPHRTIKYTVKKLLDLKDQRTGDLLNSTYELTEFLAGRYKQLKERLEACGWEVLEAQAGVSIIAKPSTLLGKTFKINKGDSTCEFKLDDSNVREAMLRATGLCINSASWTGIPGFCCLTMALDDSDFERSLECISNFKSLVC